MQDKDEQADELLALASIYSEESIMMDPVIDGVSSSGKLFINVDLPSALHIQPEKSGERHSIKHLPPVALRITLPADYPSINPPIYELTCPWLTDKQLAHLCTELDSLWKDNAGMVILFTWMSFIQTSTFDLLKLPGDTLVLSRNVFDALLEHDVKKSAQEFASTLFTCEVCFRDRPGSQSTCFDMCRHVYCKDCMREYFSTQINEGNVMRLTCPWEDCKTQATAQQVRELVSTDLYERYDELLLRLSLDTTADLIYCPRKDCGYPVEIDRVHGMGRCPSCQFTFCTYCNKTYHYPANCAITSSFAELRDKYMNAGEAEKAELERRYGKKQIQDLIHNGFTTEWMEKYSKKCPHCRAQIQKIDGCNKMACGKCDSYFCWLCLEVLPRDKPYAHFNNQQSRCFDKLFHGLEREQADDDNLILNNDDDEDDEF